MKYCLSFAQAMVALKEGKRVARSGWNGKGMWVCYMPATRIPAELVNERTRKFVPEGDLYVGGYFVLWTSADIWQPGWLASQADLLADDWMIVE